MESLFETHLEKLKRLKSAYVREFIHSIEWNDRLIGIKGARGVGKTTLLLQKIKSLNLPPEKALYVSLDDLWFSKNNLIDLIKNFVQRGGEYLFIDEVHKYATWSQEIKNAYDTWDELNIVFTGSSMLHIHDSRADLSRRAMIYSMQGLSFREYLNISLGLNLPILSLEDILNNHTEIANDLTNSIKPLAHFNTYLKNGYYPFSFEQKANYNERLKQTVLYMIEVDLVQLRNISAQHINQLKKLLYILAQSVPFKPNMVKLAEQVGVARNTLFSYLSYLEEAELLFLLHSEGTGNKLMQKPEKIFLHNPNLLHALSSVKTEIGTLKEIFFLNQVSKLHKVAYSEKGDFLVNDSSIFEIGGRNKDFSQIADLPNSFLALDDIEFSVGNRIPLYLFGFLY